MHAHIKWATYEKLAKWELACNRKKQAGRQVFNIALSDKDERVGSVKI